MTALPKSIWRDYFETICVCVIFVLFSRAFVFQQSKIPTGSMIDTLLIGDYIMVNKFVYGSTASGIERAILPIKPIERGDVVVFKYPNEPETDYIKRVIGLPGDKIEILDEVVYVNDEALDEPYVRHDHEHGMPIRRWGPRIVPEESYFCMGDNRDHSSDSRIWGPVHRSLIKGRAVLVWWSYKEDPNAFRETALRDRIASFLSKIVHFIPRTRWSRMFTIIH